MKTIIISILGMFLVSTAQAGMMDDFIKAQCEKAYLSTLNYENSLSSKCAKVAPTTILQSTFYNAEVAKLKRQNKKYNDDALKSKAYITEMRKTEGAYTLFGSGKYAYYMNETKDSEGTHYSLGQGRPVSVDDGQNIEYPYCYSYKFVTKKELDEIVKIKKSGKSESEKNEEINKIGKTKVSVKDLETPLYCTTTQPNKGDCIGKYVSDPILSDKSRNPCSLTLKAMTSCAESQASFEKCHTSYNATYYNKEDKYLAANPNALPLPGSEEGVVARPSIEKALAPVKGSKGAK